MRMRILVLEDSPERYKGFRRKFLNDHLVIVATAGEAIHHLQETRWDLLCLDHDLGGDTFVPSGPGTGFEVAEWLSQNPERMPTTVVIHSFNPSGAKRMKQMLTQAIVAPGFWSQA